MEKDKLEEGKKTFQEDKEKYEKFKLDLTAKSQQTEDEVRKVQKQLEDLTAEINNLKKQEAEFISKESKLEEETHQHKGSKRFLDLLAIAQGGKKPVSQKRRKRMKEQMDRNQEEADRQDPNSGKDFFMTQAQPKQNDSLYTKKATRMKTVGKTSFVKSNASNKSEDENARRSS